MQPHEKVSRPVSKRQMILNNFLGGIFWGIGSALGAILLLALLGFIVSKLDFVPIIGDFMAEVTRNMEKADSETYLPFTEPSPTPKSD